jgi:hypothetical protein
VPNLLKLEYRQVFTSFVETGQNLIHLQRRKFDRSSKSTLITDMAQDATSALIVEIIAVLVACVGIYVTWRVTKGKVPLRMIDIRRLLNLHTGPLRRWQRQHAHQLPIHNRRQQFRRRFGVMFVDEFVAQDWPENWFPMTADTGAHRLAGIVN